MLRHREKVLAHAERELARAGKRDSTETLALYKRFVKMENHRLQLRHGSGGGGREVCAGRAELIDILLRHLFANACESAGADPAAAGLSLVAVGGYGRGELNPYSDIDILFLHGGRRTLPAAAGHVIERMLYLLWDVGFKVGHSTRTAREAIAHANGDMLSKTSLLESRHLVGDPALFEELWDGFLDRCVRGHEEEYIRSRVKNQAERHAKFGGSVFMQEPNIKSGCGGLRDYQNLLWVAFFKERIKGTDGLVKAKLMSKAEQRELDDAYDFLLRTRNELHFLSRRAIDALGLPVQFKIADRFGYPGKNPLRRSEAFMREYYGQARLIFRTTRLLAERMSIPAETPRAGFSRLLPAPKKEKPQRFDGFEAAGGRIAAPAADVFEKDPFRLIRLFQHAQIRHLSIAPELQQLVRGSLRLVDRTFQYSRAAREVFAAILSRKGEVGRVLRMMHDADLLGRYLPEFGALTCLVQHEFFHRYSADEHTLVCIEKLDAVADPNNARFARYRDLFTRLADPYVLYLALLLHDTGKAANARHHAEASAQCAGRVAARLQLLPARRRSLLLLVDHHLTLSQTAQRRNVEDPATVAEFAAVVQNQDNLDALMLLTLADGLGTGGETWSDWKESLVWDLYNNASRYLSVGEAFHELRKSERAELKTEVRGKMAKDYAAEIEAHFESMPDSYFHGADAGDVAGHLRLFRRLFEGLAREGAEPTTPALRWTARPAQGHSEVWVCTWDRKELLARLAGSFAAAGLNILSADIFTRLDNLVLDIFRVCGPEHEPVTEEKTLLAVEKTMRKALSTDSFDFAPLLAKARSRLWATPSPEIDFPIRIAVLNDAHPVYTVVELQVPDRIALLYDILRAFATESVNILFSRIATENGAALDAFYVTGPDGRKIEAEPAVRRLQKALRSACEKKE